MCKMKNVITRDKVDRLVGQNLRIQMKSNQIVPLILKLISFLALYLALPTLQKSLNSVKKWTKYGVFGVREFSV